MSEKIVQLNEEVINSFINDNNVITIRVTKCTQFP